VVASLAPALPVVLHWLDEREQERVREDVTQRAGPFSTPDRMELQAVSLAASGA
jgi:hypothetical protein